MAHAELSSEPEHAALQLPRYEREGYGCGCFGIHSVAVKAPSFGEDSLTLAEGVVELRERKYTGKRALKADAGFDVPRQSKPKNGPCPAIGGRCTEVHRHG